MNRKQYGKVMTCKIKKIRFRVLGINFYSINYKRYNSNGFATSYYYRLFGGMNGWCVKVH